ncbi:MAG: flagellin [Ignavibacteriales bacterium]|nr:flagellin [Ignavibacteriales bacterium]
MGFSINTNSGALDAYNALSKTNAATAQAQLRLATLKKINSVADDTSGFNVGKKLEAQNLKMKAQLGNISSAKNYLSTAEMALQQINDKLNQIQAKQTDADDPLKNSASIASDIRTLAGEIDSILKNTNINGTQLLASTDGSTALSNASFDVGGASFSVDFADTSILSSSTMATLIGTGSLQSTTDSDVINADTTTVVNNVRNALGRIGNLQQSLGSREEFLTASITNNASTLSNIFDADVVLEQMNASRGQIAQQIGTAMFAQMNASPQNLLSLFR